MPNGHTESVLSHQKANRVQSVVQPAPGEDGAVCLPGKGWTQIRSRGPQNSWAGAGAGATGPDGTARWDLCSRLQGRPVIGWERDLWEEGQAAEG